MLYFLVFIEGYISLAYQMLFIRQLTPEVGASAVTSSWIVGFFLLALAMGYKKGGKVVDEPLQLFARNLMKAGAWGGLSASSIFVASFFSLFNQVSLFGNTLPLVWYCMLFVAPVAFWMGQSLPLLIQKSKWGSDTSEISGNALYLSTIGSFVGAVATTNILFVLFGAGMALLGVSIISLIIAFVLASGDRVVRFYAVTVSVVLLFLNIGVLMPLGMHSTAYSDVFINVNKETNVREFMANGTVMSRLKDGANHTWYLDQYYDLIQKEKIQNADVLVLGAGGFVAHLSEGDTNQYTYVDIDSELKDITEAEFLQKEVTADFVVSDARRYLIDNTQKRDVIFMDVFSSSAIPAHLATQEFFKLIRDRINVDGFLVINTIMDPRFTSVYSKRFHLTILSVFPFCNRVVQPGEGAVRNVVYTCKKLDDVEHVYKDDFNTQEFDYAKMTAFK